MASSILVINPNSTEAVTAGIDAALDPLRLEDGPRIRCVTLHDGPPGIETQAHVDQAALLVARAVAETLADAYVVACFSDPGLHAAREATTKPVLGIAESGLLTALSLGARVGVVAVLSRSIPRHTRYFRALGVADRIAGEEAVDLPVVALADESRTAERMLTVGRTLTERHGADVLVMGCAGMAKYRERLEAALGVPVVDPSQAAVGLAIAMVRLRLAPRAQR